jgi:mRNA-degrading endonuclease toxin of MazEF toxin-antitoxin module
MKKAAASKQRPALPLATDEAKRMAALLAAEMLRWRDVRLGKMFGLVSVYRGDVFFAWLPATRGFQTPHGVAIKLNPGTLGEKKWERIEVASESDLRVALERLEKAYEKASK